MIYELSFFHYKVCNVCLHHLYSGNKTIKWDFFPICYRKDSHDINVITEITKLC